MTKQQWSATAVAVLAGWWSGRGGRRQAVAVCGAAPPRSETRERNLRTYVELMRSDIRTQKVALITETLLLTEGEGAIFWPIYREYDAGTEPVVRRANSIDRHLRRDLHLALGRAG